MKTFPDNAFAKYSIIGELSSTESTETSSESGEDTNINQAVMKVRALVGRLSELRAVGGDVSGNEEEEASSAMESLLDPDIILESLLEENPEVEKQAEYREIETMLKDLVSRSEVLDLYRKMFVNWGQNLHQLKRAQKVYKAGEITKSTVKGETVETEVVHDLSEQEKVLLAQQIIRILEFFKKELDQEIQNIHNQVASEKRDYKESDEKVLEKLHRKLDLCQTEIDSLIANNHEVAIRLRMDQLRDDSDVLKRVKKEDPRDIDGWKKSSAYIETGSRHDTIYGNGGSENYVLGNLRGGQNVEIAGPTGTGKTKIAIYAAKVFSGQDPVVISGGPGVYRSTFYGSPIDLGKRNRGVVVQCIEEDRIMIIDEDNRIDPRQMAEIKFMLGLKSGDEWIHPDTGESYTIPPHFRVMVTRNERGKHHKDRFDLPPEYRREFTHGSYEIDYYPPAEMYERFFLPKLINNDGSVKLSKEEIDGDTQDPSKTSPLFALAVAAKKIQELYKENKLVNAVFESGYLINLLDQWKEMRFKKDTNGKPVSFIRFLNTKLLEFVKRNGIGNQDRKMIIETLYEYGFFRDYDYSDFETANDGPMFADESAFEALVQSNDAEVFKKPSGVPMSAREVALLDPFHQRDIEVPPHRLEAEINAFAETYQEFCREVNIRPIIFSPDNIERKRKSIVQGIEEGLDGGEIKSNNKSQMTAMLDIINDKAGIEDFLKKLSIVLKVLKQQQQ